MPPRACVRCSKFGVIQSRGLCPSCYRAHKDDYPRLTDAPPNDHEPTEAELDAMIAEQYANLPAWWFTDVRARR